MPDTMLMHFNEERELQLVTSMQHQAGIQRPAMGPKNYSRISQNTGDEKQPSARPSGHLIWVEPHQRLVPFSVLGLGTGPVLGQSKSFHCFRAGQKEGDGDGWGWGTSHQHMVWRHLTVLVHFQLVSNVKNNKRQRAQGCPYLEDLYVAHCGRGQ